ncbi:MAG: dihydrofolate reductase family protein [Terrimesophilobacter sp.]
MMLAKVFPAPAHELSLESNVRKTLSSLYEMPKEQWLRINLISTVNGNVAGHDGTSEGLTNKTDRSILGAIRSLSDIVLVGANSVRKEGYFLPKNAPLAIVTGSGELGGHRIPSDVDAGAVIVLCPQNAEATVRASLGDTPVTVITLPGPRLDPGDLIEALHDHGYDSIVCEGGPNLAGQLLDAGLVDELCLSTSPLINGVNLPAFQGLTHSKHLHLTQLLVDAESALYARWSVQNEAGAQPATL